MRRRQSALWWWAVALWAALTIVAPGSVWGHVTGEMGYATVSVHGGTVRYTLALGLDSLAALGGEAGPGTRLMTRDGKDTLAGLIARKVSVIADGLRCRPVPDSVTPPSPDRATVIVTVDYACPAGLRELVLRDDLGETLGPDYHTLVSINIPGGPGQLLLEPSRREARIIVAAPDSGATPTPPAEGGVFAFFHLGVEHILGGFDHLLFLFALLLRGGGIGSLLAIATAFTAAHSITLALAVLRVVSIPPSVVEPVIALSIAYVAAENILSEPRTSWRWAEGFGFGLVHGFGFAGALLELALPTAALAWPLLSFNLGVEAGQAVVIAVLFPGLIWLRRSRLERRVAMTLSAFVLIAGLALLIERILVAAG